MAGDSDRFTHALVRMLQTGVFQQCLGCEAGETAAVTFRLERSYHVRLTRRTIVVEEHDGEEVHRKMGGRWQRLGRPMVHRRRIVLERTTGKILQAPGLGVAPGHARRRRRRSRTPSALILAA